MDRSCNETGIEACDIASTYSGPDRSSIELKGECVDNAGNLGQNTFTFNYDSTKPQISSTQQGKRFILNQKVIPSFQCSDPTSGIINGTKGCSIYVIYNVHNMSGMIQMNQKNPTTRFLNTTTVGTHSYNIIAED